MKRKFKVGDKVRYNLSSENNQSSAYNGDVVTIRSFYNDLAADGFLSKNILTM